MQGFFNLLKINFIFIICISIANSFHTRHFPTGLRTKAYLASLETVNSEDLASKVISISPRAMDHILSLKSKQQGDLSLRMG